MHLLPICHPFFSRGDDLQQELDLSESGDENPTFRWGIVFFYHVNRKPLGFFGEHLILIWNCNYWSVFFFSLLSWIWGWCASLYGVDCVVISVGPTKKGEQRSKPAWHSMESCLIAPGSFSHGLWKQSLYIYIIIYKYIMTENHPPYTP